MGVWVRGDPTAMPMLTCTDTSLPPRLNGAKRGLDAHGRLFERRVDVAALQQHRELVAAETDDAPAGVGGGGDSGCDRNEEAITGAVTEAVVDDLEAVHVEEQHGHRALGGLGAIQCLLDAVEEQRAVRETRQGVV